MEINVISTKYRARSKFLINTGRSCTHALHQVMLNAPVLSPFLCLLLNLVSNQVSHQVIYVSHALFTTFCFLKSTLNPFSLILMIIFMTMGLCWFPGSSHITVNYLFIIYPPYCLLSIICAPFSGQPLCTSEWISSPESFYLPLTWLFPRDCFKKSIKILTSKCNHLTSKLLLLTYC